MKPSDEVKQVVCIRHDLNMRKGKYGAQCGHAFCEFFQQRALSGKPFTEDQLWWMQNAHPKVVCKVTSEEEIRGIYEQALAAGIECYLIEDSGRTEFGGVPTITALGIGPDRSSKIDPITRHLPLG